MPNGGYGFDDKWIPEVGGFGGQTYQGIPNVPGVPGGIQNQHGYPAAAQAILTGSAGAQQSLIEAYRAQYQQRAEGIASAQGEMTDRLGAQGSSQGFSNDIIQRMLLGSNAQTQRDIGAARGEGEKDFGIALAELLKGTGGEIASLKMHELQQVIQAYVASKARSAAKKTAGIAAIGGAVGLAGQAAFGGVGGGGAGTG